jgi:hypothetical protein
MNMNKLYTVLFFSTLFCFSIVSKIQAQTQLTVTILNQTPVCNMDASVTLGITGGVGPFTSHWLTYGLNQQLDTSLTSTSNPVTGLGSGYYSVHVYDANGLFGQTGVYINPPFFINTQLTPATCNESDGKIVAIVNDTAASSPPFTYEWSTGAINNSSNNRDSIENIPSGTYQLKVTNAQGCVSTLGEGGTSSPNFGGLNLWSTSTITATSTATPSNCFDGTATVVAANGEEPYQYYWNTNPVQSAATAIGLAPGFYQCLVTDAEGCQRNVFVNVPAGPNFLQVNSTQVNTTCNQTNGSINVTVSGGQAPYTYAWSNGETTANISGLAYGHYQLVVTDNAGCSVTVNKFISFANPMHFNFSGNSPSCNASDGSVTLQISGGQAPFDIIWFDSSTTQNTIANLPIGPTTVTVTDANGCVKNGYYYLPIANECLANISGRIIADHNEDCAPQVSEPGIANVIVRAGNNFTNTNNNGNYSLLVNPGEYDVTQYPPAIFEQLCPVENGSINVNASNQATTYGGNNFYNASETIFSDVAVYLYSGPIRPGFQATYYITVRNHGVTSANPTLSFSHDGLLNYLFATPSAGNYTLATRTATWNVGPLAPNQSKHYQVRFNVSLDALDFLGSEIDANAQVSLISAIDIEPENNSVTYSRIITGSYDPNDKQVSPIGLTDAGLILKSDTLFKYLIRFQNTGNDTAFTVVVRDTLDANLDVTTFNLLGYSHPMEFKVSDQGVLTFTFNNILLPDSNINEPASHGYIEYNIQSKKDLDFGTKIKNTAYIYFDFNPPIITNTTLNTIYDPFVGIPDLANFDFVLYPNPNDGKFFVNLNLTHSARIQVEIIDLSGRSILREDFGHLNSGQRNLEINSEEVLKSGVYFVRITSGNESIVKKVVVR